MSITQLFFSFGPAGTPGVDPPASGFRLAKFNAARKGTSVTLSASDSIATWASSTDMLVELEFYRTQGKYWVEFELQTGSNVPYHAAGVTTAAAGVNSYVGGDVNGRGISEAATRGTWGVDYGGANTGIGSGLSQANTASVMGLYIDLDTRKMFLHVSTSGSGGWIGDNPVTTPAGGVSFSTPAGAVAAAFSTYTSGAGVKLRIPAEYTMTSVAPKVAKIGWDNATIWYERGVATIGADNFPCSGGRAMVDLIALPKMLVTNIGVAYNASTTAGANAKFIIHANASGTPGALIAATEAVAIPAGAGISWARVTTPVEIAAGNYWVGQVTDNFQPYMAHNTSAGGGLTDMAMANGTYNYTTPGAWPGNDATYPSELSAQIRGFVYEEYAVFSGATANGTISNEGRTFERASGSVANCLTNAPILEPTYFEMSSPLVGTAGSQESGWASLYGGDNPTLSTSVIIGQWWGEEGASMFGKTWSDNYTVLHGSGDEEVGSMVSHGSAQTDPVVMQYAVSGRNVWMKTDNMVGWMGGGDPAAGTTPTFVMPGSAPIYAAASADAASKVVTLMLPKDYVGTAPAGFRSGILAPV